MEPVIGLLAAAVVVLFILWRAAATEAVSLERDRDHHEEKWSQAFDEVCRMRDCLRITEAKLDAARKALK